MAVLKFETNSGGTGVATRDPGKSQWTVAMPDGTIFRNIASRAGIMRMIAVEAGEPIRLTEFIKEGRKI